MDKDLLSMAERWVELDLEKRELKGKLNKIESEMKDMEESLAEAMEEAGVQNMKIKGLTIHIIHEIYASPKRAEDETIDEAHQRAYLKLIDYGYDNVGGIRINHNSLSKVVREMIEESGDLPDDLKEVIEVSETTKVGTRLS